MTARLTLTVLVVLTAMACGEDKPSDPKNGSDGLEFLNLPEGFPKPRIPEDNALTQEKAELGRYLFFDVRLSGNETQSCSTCHEQELAFADGKVTAEGSTGHVLARNSPGLANTAYNATLTWANPVLTELEQQLLVPIFGEDPIELGATGFEDAIIDRLAEDPVYVQLFADAFPGEAEPIHWDNVVKGLASFVRTMISGNSPFDQFTYGGDLDALSPAARRGLELFYSENLECHHCHGGFNFSEATVHDGTVFDAALFQNTGLYNIDGNGAYPANNTGVYAITGNPDDMGRFRAPTLRNIALTAPYMHDGSIETLYEVIRHYEEGGRVITEGPYAGDGRISPLKSGLVAGFRLEEEERRDLIAFFESLTDQSFIEDSRFSNPFPTE